MVIKTALFIGVESDNPLKNIFMLTTMPKRAQPIKRTTSFLLIFSLGNQKLMSQNKMAAPKTRSKINP